MGEECWKSGDGEDMAIVKPTTLDWAMVQTEYVTKTVNLFSPYDDGCHAGARMYMRAS